MINNIIYDYNQSFFTEVSSSNLLTLLDIISILCGENFYCNNKSFTTDINKNGYYCINFGDNKLLVFEQSFQQSDNNILSFIMEYSNSNNRYFAVFKKNNTDYSIIIERNSNNTVLITIKDGIIRINSVNSTKSKL